MVHLCLIDTLDANSAPYTILANYDLPDAVLSDDARGREGAGFESEDYLPAPWTITWVIQSDDSGDAAEYLATLTRALVNGAKLTWADDGASLTSYTYLKSAECVGSERYGTWIRATFSGLRYPAWHGDTGTVLFTGAATSYTGALPLAVDLDTVPDGELRTALSIKALPSVASDFVAVGIKSSPAAGYAPIQDYAATTLAMTSSYATIGTPTSLDAAANRGDALVFARAKTDSAAASATSWKAVSEVTTSFGTSSADSDAYANAATGTYEHLSLGRVRIPAADISITNAGDSEWLAETEEITQTSGTGVAVPSCVLSGTTHYVFGQSFTLTGARRFRGVSVEKTSTTASGAYVVCRLYSGSRPGVQLASRTETLGTSSGVKHYDMDVEIGAGTYCFTVDVYGLASAPSFKRDTTAPYAGGDGFYRVSPSGYATGDGTDTTIDWYFKVHTQQLITFGTTVDIQAKCTESSKTATLGHLTLLPLDEGAAVAVGTFGASEGVLFDASSYDRQRHATYHVDATNQGVALDTEWYGARFGLKPGVSNRLIVEAGTNNSTGNVTLTGTYIERFIHRMRG